MVLTLKTTTITTTSTIITTTSTIRTTTSTIRTTISTIRTRMTLNWARPCLLLRRTLVSGPMGCGNRMTGALIDVLSAELLHGTATCFGTPASAAQFSRLIYWFSVILSETHTVDWLIDRVILRFDCGLVDWLIDWLIRLISISFWIFCGRCCHDETCMDCADKLQHCPKDGCGELIALRQPKVKPAKWHLPWWQRLCSVASFVAQRTFSNFSISAIKFVHTKKPRCQST